MRRVAREEATRSRGRRRSRMVVLPTYKELAEQVQAETAGSWKKEKYAAQWLST